MSKIEIKGLNKSFIKDKETLQVLNSIDLLLAQNQFISILGPSGCGKSTILRILTGLEKDYHGDIWINGTNLHSFSNDNEAKFAYMPQKDLLMPWRTVYKNIILPLEIKGVKKPLDNISSLIKEFGLDGFENYYPGEISGGMRQRAGLLRTFLIESDTMLLDEPFGALDAITRMKMQDWLLNILAQHKKSVVFITHDIDEAIYLSDIVYVLSERPGSVLETLNIQFPRPRKREMLLTDKFLYYKNIILKKLNL